MLDQVVRKLIEYGYERALRQEFLAGSVKLGADQLPDVWADAPRRAARGWTSPRSPDLYLTQFPVTNAAAIGAGTPMVVVNSRTRRGPRRARGAHRARPRGRPHPLRPRALPDRADDPAVGDRRSGGCRCSPACRCSAVKLALLEWFRAAELSCDRAATLVNRDPLVTCRTLMVLAGGTSSRKLDLDAFMRQATEYEEWESGWDKLARVRIELGQTHSFPVRASRS